MLISALSATDLAGRAPRCGCSSLLLLGARLVCRLGGKQPADDMDDAVVGHDVRLQDFDLVDQHTAFGRIDVERRP
jgi:hypothetical protein